MRFTGHPFACVHSQLVPFFITIKYCNCGKWRLKMPARPIFSRIFHLGRDDAHTFFVYIFQSVLSLTRSLCLRTVRWCAVAAACSQNVFYRVHTVYFIKWRLNNKSAICANGNCVYNKSFSLLSHTMTHRIRTFFFWFRIKI